MMSVKIQGEGILKVKKAMHVPILHFPGRGWRGGDLRGGKGLSNQTTLHRKFVIFLEQHILKSIYLLFLFFLLSKQG